MSIKALLLAAGFGTRLKPLTDIWPKCLMPINGRPLLEYCLGILKQQKMILIFDTKNLNFLILN